MKNIKNIIFKSFGINIKSEQLWEKAFTHASHSAINNQCLEFLGDSVLGLIITQFLYKKFKTSEGLLSEYKARLVSKGSCVRYMNELKIANYIRTNKSLITNKVALNSILADTFEAVLGAMFLECGYNFTEKMFHKKFSQIVVDVLATPPNNYKGAVQEYAQKKRLELSYKLDKTAGQEHKKEFFMTLHVGNTTAKGQGYSKKEAEQNAAKNMLKRLK